MTDTHIILASNSPRRRELLKRAGFKFTVCPSNADEDIEPAFPSKYVERLAAKKAGEVYERLKNEGAEGDKLLPDKYIVLGADTVVSLGGRILGKPYDYDDAYNTLNSLAGQTHQVYTGVCLICAGGGAVTKKVFSEKTDVTFYPMSHDEIVSYLATDEPFDKAGSYGIQGLGGIFVKEIHGDYNNVVGLPIARVYHEIEKLV